MSTLASTSHSIFVPPMNQKVTIKTCDKIREDCKTGCKFSREQRDKYIERIYEDAVESCDEVKKEVERKAHTHATLGQAGEVIK